MNILSFYEYVILRDILAFILPGGITLGGIYMILQAMGIDRWEKTLPIFSDKNSILVAILIISISFLIGHIWDRVYRLLYQNRKTFRVPTTIKKVLIGNQMVDPNLPDDHIASEIRFSVGQFLNIDWENTSLEQWIDSGEAYRASVLMAYWIEEEDPKLFGNEIGRPIVQAHFLHVCGLASYFFGACVLITSFVQLAGISSSYKPDLLILGILTISSVLFGRALIRQGIHKRDVIMEHVFRVFYVLWRKYVRQEKERSKKSKQLTKKD